MYGAGQGVSVIQVLLAKTFSRCSLAIKYLNNLHGQLDEQSIPVLQGAWDSGLYYSDTYTTRALENSDVLGKTELSTETCVTELSGLKGLDFPGATIDARRARITLGDASLAAGTMEGLPLIHFALNQRYLSISEASRKSSQMAILHLRHLGMEPQFWMAGEFAGNQSCTGFRESRGKKSVIDGVWVQTCLHVDRIPMEDSDVWQRPGHIDYSNI